MIEVPELGRRIVATLARVRRRTGVSLAFGGEVTADGEVALRRFDGPTVGALSGVTLELGHGLGGKVVAQNRTLAVDDYVDTSAITHRYDGVIRREGLRAMVATPVIVARRPVAVIYGALRDAGAIADRIQDAISHEARALEQEIAVARSRSDDDTDNADILRDRIRHAHQRLRAVAGGLTDATTRALLHDVCDDLVVGPDVCAVPLTGRELDVLSLAAAGLSNPAIGEALGLTLHTTKSYMKSAMQKLGAATRLEAVVLARRAGQLP